MLPEDVPGDIASQLEFSNALKSLKCLGSKVLAKSGHNVSAIGELFFIDTDGNTCADEGSPNEIVEVKKCDGSVTEKRRMRRHRQREKGRKWRKLERQRKARELIALNKKENTEAAGSLQQQTSSINPASSNVGDATKGNVDGAELFVEKQRKKNKWTRERKRLAKEAREVKAAKKAQKAEAAKKMHPPISSSKVGNCHTDIGSLGSEFFVIDRQGRMEDGEGGNKGGLDGMENLEGRNGDEERKLAAKEEMEDGAKRNGDEGGNKGGLDGMENLERRNGDKERKIVKKKEMEDGAKRNGDDCEGGNKGGMENLKRRNFYKKRKRFSAKEENIVNVKMYRERKRKKKNKRQTLIDRQGKMKEDVAKRNGDDCEGGKGGLTKENGMKNLKRRKVNEYGNKGTKKMKKQEVHKTRAMLDWEKFVRSLQRK
ncbi:hypothetical protein LSTR_LSTR007200 [Laodelphax striatellus]|uniref:Uncharacterized protein n=2 Tax=Laodelphax striatellus TaxID=195883 RepID=A0A482WS79_LAOST|nr:hypothetical protein LSTR_LSTR007200 [Laodelphax striatellus]